MEFCLIQYVLEVLVECICQDINIEATISKYSNTAAGNFFICKVLYSHNDEKLVYT